MNDLFMTLGIESWKPLLGAVLLPPAPLLLMVLAGARLIGRRRGLGWTLVLTGVLGVWFAGTGLAAAGLENALLRPPRALGSADIAELRRAPRTAIVVLGGGSRPLAPEYGVSTLLPRGVERLRYGIWLARETALPLAFSGGVAWGHDGTPEADIAARMSEREFGQRLRWVESESRDTRENALRTVALLQPQGIEQVVLVTHYYHMRRALRDFERAAGGSRLRLVAAPMGLRPGGRAQAADWLPSSDGYERTRIALHEWLGYLAGA